MPDTSNPTITTSAQTEAPQCQKAPSVQVLKSSELLGTGQAVDIEHNGQRYRLQTTKAGKLILTK
jgi:hemin uptake protein HemP